MDRADNDSYILRVLVSIDQLGNTIAGGHPGMTVSARTGYFANVKKTTLRPWWLFMEKMIDLAFLPIDGPKHCYTAYNTNKKENKHREGSDIARAILGIFIILVCIPISLITRIWVMLSPDCRYRPMD